jgi:hypothetical protein
MEKDEQARTQARCHNRWRAKPRMRHRYVLNAGIDASSTCKLVRSHVRKNPEPLLFRVHRSIARLSVAAVSGYQRMLSVFNLTPMLRSIFVAASITQGACWYATANEFQAGLQISAVQSQRQLSYLALAPL